MKNILTLLIFIGAALLEVGGDALIRKGLRGSSFGFLIGGFIILGVYGILVNTVKWEFSSLEKSNSLLNINVLRMYT